MSEPRGRARAFLAHQRARLDRVPTLEDALLGQRPLRYALYRLKYVGARALLRTGFRLFELALFAAALSFEVLGPILVVRSVMLVGEAMWWGALETLRRDVRLLHARDRSPLPVIRQWLGLASVLATAVLLASGAWVLWGPSPFVGFDVIDLFVLCCGGRWALDLLVRTYHSGAYGIRRVYRPAWSLFAVDVADVVLLVSAYLWVGAWGLGPAFLLGGLFRAVLTRRFVAATYRDLRVAVGRPQLWWRRLRTAQWSPRHTFLSAFGNAVAQLDAFLVLGLLSAPATADGSLLLAALFHGVAPLQAAAFTWSRLFYFDFKRLEGWGSPFLLQRFEAFLARVARWVPLPIAGCMLALLATFWNGPYWLLWLELAALVAVRVRLSLLHVRAYSLSDHAFLGKLFASLLPVVAITPWLGTLPADVSVGAVALLAAVGAFFLDRSRRLPEVGDPTRTTGLARWVAELLAQQGSVSIGLVCVDRRLASPGRVLRALGPALGRARVARLSRDAWVWFAGAEERPEREHLIVLGAGTIRELRLADAAPNGKRALFEGVKSHSWHWHLGRHLERARREVLDVGWLERCLQELDPSVRLIRLNERFDAGQVAHHAVREIRRLVLDAARGRAGWARLGADRVAVVAPGGDPQLLVLMCPEVAPSSTRSARAAELIRCAELALTLERSGKAAPVPARA